MTKLAHPWVLTSAGIIINPRGNFAGKKNIGKDRSPEPPKTVQAGKCSGTHCQPSPTHPHSTLGSHPLLRPKWCIPKLPQFNSFIFLKNTSRGQRNTDNWQVFIFSYSSDPLREKNLQMESFQWVPTLLSALARRQSLPRGASSLREWYKGEGHRDNKEEGDTVFKLLVPFLETGTCVCAGSQDRHTEETTQCTWHSVFSLQVFGRDTVKKLSRKFSRQSCDEEGICSM